jgi:hypothetical protein
VFFTSRKGQLFGAPFHRLLEKEKRNRFFFLQTRAPKENTLLVWPVVWFVFLDFFLSEKRKKTSKPNQPTLHTV